MVVVDLPSYVSITYINELLLMINNSNCIILNFFLFGSIFKVSVCNCWILLLNFKIWPLVSHSLPHQGSLKLFLNPCIQLLYFVPLITDVIVKNKEEQCHHFSSTGLIYFSLPWSAYHSLTHFY